MNALSKIKWFVSFLIIFLGVSSVFAATSSEIEERSETGKISSAKNVVLAFQDELIAVMQQGEVLGFKGRYDKLETAIIKSHDLTKIARIVVGKEWRNLSNEQKSTLTDVFSRLSVSAYAYNFKAFSG